MYGDEKKVNGEDLHQVTTAGYGDVEDLSKPTREVDAVRMHPNEHCDGGMN